MDRSNELRLQMKKKQQQQQLSSTVTPQGFDSLSGKEKAKYLKMLKEKKRSADLEHTKSSQQRSVVVSSSSFASPTATASDNRPVKVLTTNQLHTSTARAAAAVTTQLGKISSSGSSVSHNKLDENSRSDSGGFLGLVSYGDSDDDEEEQQQQQQQGETAVSVNGVPAGFFDSSTATAPQPPSSLLHQSSHSHSRAPPTVEPPSTSSLPAGFFDNRVEDLEARGVDIHAAAVKLAKHEDSQLAALLDEVDAVEGALQEQFQKTVSSTGAEAEGLEGSTLVEEYEHLLQQEAKSDSELMNAAVQLAYEAKVSALLAEGERRRGKHSNSSRAANDAVTAGRQETIKTEVESLLQYMGSSESHSSSGVLASSAETSTSVVPDPTMDDSLSHSHSVADSVSEVMAARAKKRKRNKKSSGSEEDRYVPLDFMDWTARVI